MNSYISMLNQFEIDKINNFFVENYNDIKTAKDSLNEILKKFNINFNYDYDTFCKEFLKELDKNNITYEKLSNVSLVAVLFSRLLINKIPEDVLEKLMNDVEFIEFLNLK